MIGFWPDYERQCFEEFTDKNIAIHIFDPRDIFKDKKYKRLVPRNIKNFIYKNHIKQYIRRNTESIFVFQDSRVFIEFLLRKYSPRSHVLFRNTISEKNSQNIGKLKARGHSLWSFDNNDCEKYNINFYNQFTLYVPGIDKTAIEYDFSFIGRDKNRGPLLQRIKDKLEGYGFSVYTKVISDNETPISYCEYLKDSCRAKCIIDISKDGQSGITLRPIEALQYNRKLATNNEEIVKYNIYNKDNIILFREMSSMEMIREFLQRENATPGKGILEQYTFDNLVDKILTSN